LSIRFANILRTKVLECLRKACARVDYDLVQMGNDQLSSELWRNALLHGYAVLDARMQSRLECLLHKKKRTKTFVMMVFYNVTGLK
jgi:hypothetical protein